MHTIEEAANRFHSLSSWDNNSHFQKDQFEMLFPLVDVDYAGLTSLLSAQLLGQYAMIYPERFHHRVFEFGLYCITELADSNVISQEKVRALSDETAHSFMHTIDELPSREDRLDFGYIQQVHHETPLFDEQSLSQQIYDYILDFTRLFLKHGKHLHSSFGKGYACTIEEHRRDIREFLTFFFNKTPFIVYAQNVYEESDDVFCYFLIPKMQELFLADMQEHFNLRNQEAFFEVDVSRIYMRKELKGYAELTQPCVLLPSSSTPFRQFFDSYTDPLSRKEVEQENSIHFAGIQYIKSEQKIALSLISRGKPWKEILGFTSNEIEHTPAFTMDLP